MNLSQGSDNEQLSHRIIPLHYLMGEALFMIQHLEGALSRSITLKRDIRHPRNANKTEANKKLKENQLYTLGKAVKIVRESKIYNIPLLDNLQMILTERNWLVHKCVEDLYVAINIDNISKRIKDISHNAKKLQRDIELDLVEFSESIGMDMSMVRMAIKQFHGSDLESS